MAAALAACRHDWRLAGATVATFYCSLSLLGLTLVLCAATRLPWWLAALAAVAVNFGFGLNTKGRPEPWAWLDWQGRPGAQALCGVAAFTLGGALFVVRPGRILNPD
jgi:hypothetical protein